MNWLGLGSIDLTEENQVIPYDNTVHEILVSYGVKNDTQAYGGGTVVLAVGESKPCFLPCYEQNNIIGIAYIYNHYTRKINVRSYSATKTLRVNIFVR